MHTVEQLEQDLAEAMRQRDQVRLSVLRLLKNALKNQQIELGRELTSQEMFVVLQKEAKKRRDSIEAYQKANREDLVNEEEVELQTIETYLPAMLTEDEIKQLVVEAVATIDQPSMAQMGQLINTVLAKADGRADGATVSRLVKAELS